MYEEDGALHEAAIALSFAADYYVGEVRPRSRRIELASTESAVPAVGKSPDPLVQRSWSPSRRQSMYPQAVLCLTRAGEHLVEEERFGDAADRFDRAAKFCLDDNLLKFNAPSLAFNVVLCYLALRVRGEREHDSERGRRVADRQRVKERDIEAEEGE